MRERWWHNFFPKAPEPKKPMGLVITFNNALEAAAKVAAQYCTCSNDYDQCDAVVAIRKLRVVP